MKQCRIVVTGMGMLTPVGNNLAETWKNILAGKSGIRRIETFDVSEYRSKISGSVKNFDPSNYLSIKEIRHTDLFIQYGLIAAAEAIEHAKLTITEENSPHIGVTVGSGIGGLPRIENSKELLIKGGPRKLSPYFIPAIVINMAGGYISLKHHLKGPNFPIVTACATGAHNIGIAARTICYGDADVMICGGIEMATCPMGLGGFGAMHALSTRNDEPEKASRPWDKDRDGFILGDGAGIMILESLEHAQKRGATIYAELVGFGMSADAHHITAPHPEGLGCAAAMQNTLDDAGLNATDIDYINAHATSTGPGDPAEVKGIKKVFGSHAYELAVSSTKSMTGHLLGATGAVEAIFSVLAIRDQMVPPTINLDHPDEGCDLNFVPHKAQKRKIQSVLSNSFGFGGTNVGLIFKKFG
jgi:3-oxoacyl-[acyl-carrier-protein] synthase II